MLSRLGTRVDDLQQAVAAADAEVEALRSGLRDAELDRLAALGTSATASGRTRELADRLDAELAAAVGERDRLRDAEEAAARLLRRAERVPPAELTSPDAHIRHRHVPAPPQPAPRALAEFWAATSGGLLLLLVAAVLVLPTPHKPAALITALVLFLGLDAVIRGRGLQSLLAYTIVAAVVAAVVVAVTYWQWAILLTIALLVVAIVRGNVGELRSLRAAARRSND